eukprot:TRINITY_DN1738_c0_g1_i1.p1 TRINITY_DN1738_c0_g1~~TRINITY_DN1738_c0_g1_i1.p1  ORF type:complete len:348 (-),score=55.36 TRINITY_DN1738_c0_g1_i1:304-1347(-)
MIKTEQSDTSKSWSLPSENELRFEVDFGNSIKLKLVDGDAECFGTELAKDIEYTFSGINSAIFTWHGATILIVGTCHAYVADETPMVTYINCHQICNDLREEAKERKSSGPRVMVVGATDSGKSSLCSLLCNYAIRRGHQVTFVDLDVGQGSVSVPEMISAITFEAPLDIEEGFSLTPPLVQFYGSNSPSTNPTLYKLQMKHLAEDIEKKLDANPELAAAGLVINTCGWVDGLGYQLLLDSIEQFKVDIILVIDHERLFSDLNVELKQKKPGTSVVKLKKSGGVVTRDSTHRRRSRMNKIRHYFYGQNNSLSPLSIVLDFRDFVIVAVGGGDWTTSLNAGVIKVLVF